MNVILAANTILTFKSFYLIFYAKEFLTDNDMYMFTNVTVRTFGEGENTFVLEHYV